MIEKLYKFHEYLQKSEKIMYGGNTTIKMEYDEQIERIRKSGDDGAGFLQLSLKNLSELLHK